MLRGIIHGGADISGFVANAGLAAARVAIGLMMAFGHGLGKVPPPEKFIAGVEEMGFPMPLVFAWLAGLSELVGGLFIALGLATRPAALACAGTMIVAGFVRHAPDPFKVKELAFVYLASMVLFACVGSGKYGLDDRLRQHRA